MSGGFTVREKERTCLAGWIEEGGSQIKWTLLYDGQRDGMNIYSLHNMCKGHGHGITVLVDNPLGYLFGVYIHAKIPPDGGWVDAGRSFLFTIRDHNGRSCSYKYLARRNCKVCLDVEQGICFSSDGENKIAFLDITANGPEIRMKHFAKMGRGFEQCFFINDVTTLCGGDADICNIHTYRVDEILTRLATPWRPDIKWNKQNFDSLRQDVINYATIDGVGVEIANILLVGPIGAGKSSLFNTMNSTIQGQITAQASAGSQTGSLTRKYRKYPLRLTTGNQNRLHIRLCDTMGLEEEDGLEGDQFNYILDGNIKDNYCFNLRSGIMPSDEKFNKTPTLKDKIHVVAILLDSLKIGVYQENDPRLRKLRTIKKNAMFRGIPVLLVLTKVDELCQETGNDVSAIFYSRVVRDVVSRGADLLGIPKKDIAVLRNYESETECVTNVDILALVTLRQMLRLADNFLDDQWDRQLQENETQQRIAEETARRRRLGEVAQVAQPPQCVNRYSNRNNELNGEKQDRETAYSSEVASVPVLAPERNSAPANPILPPERDIPMPHQNAEPQGERPLSNSYIIWFVAFPILMLAICIVWMTLNSL